MALTAKQKLELVRLAVYSSSGPNKTISAEQALSVIGALFEEPPTQPLSPERLPVLLAAIAAAQRPRRRGEVDHSVDVAELQRLLGARP